VEGTTVTPAVPPEETPGPAALLTVALEPDLLESPSPAAALTVNLEPYKGQLPDLNQPLGTNASQRAAGEYAEALRIRRDAGI
jgi:hypothetical protein